MSIVRAIDPRGHGGALTPRQAEFVREFVANGGHAKSAAKSAGYLGDKEAYRLLKEPKVLKAISDEVIRAFACNAPKAHRVLVDLMTSSASDNVRLKAALVLLEYAGFRPAEPHDIIMRDERSDREILEDIEALRIELGLAAGDG